MPRLFPFFPIYHLCIAEPGNETTIQWVYFAGENFCEFHVSVANCESFICEKLTRESIHNLYQLLPHGRHSLPSTDDSLCLLISRPLIPFYQSRLVLYRWQHLLRPSWLPTRMKQVVDRQGGRKNSTLTSKREVYAHFTPKEQVQTEKQAGNLDSIK